MEIKFKKPVLEDREIITAYFQKYQSRSCERSFANIYLWSRHYKVEYAILEDVLVFRNLGKEKIAFAWPVGAPDNIRKVLPMLEEYSHDYGQELILYHVTKEAEALLEEWEPGAWQTEYNRDLADYVYETEKLATLSGKKLHGKRNHINKFKATHEDWNYETLDEGNVEECFQMALKWRNMNGCDDDPEKNTEMCVTLNSLRLLKELKLRGGILRVNGEIQAFSIGEPLSDDTFVVHIEKAFGDFDGAYPMINQQFVQHECMDYQYVNREEDTGAEGLRKAKLSYRPAMMIEKGVAKRI